MRKATTTTIVTITLIILAFVILIGAASGLFTSPESLQTQIVQGVFGLLMLIGGFYYGSSNRHNVPSEDDNSSNNQNQTKKMKQVFWDITDVNQIVEKVNGVPFGYDIPTLISGNSTFEILKDDTDIDVLVVTTETSVSLQLESGISISQAADFIGGRPVRK